MTKAPDVNDQVPSPIDLRDAAAAAAGTAAADVNRPWRARLRSAIAELLRDTLPAPLRVFEDGPGPGLLAEAVLDACQVGGYTRFDFSAPMLDMYRQRVGDRVAPAPICAPGTRP